MKKGKPAKNTQNAGESYCKLLKNYVIFHINKKPPAKNVGGFKCNDLVNLCKIASNYLGC